MKDHELDPGIPVLTEIVMPADAPHLAPATVVSSTLSPDVSPPDLDTLTAELTHNVQQQLQERLDALFETHVRERIDGALLAMRDQLAVSISAGIQQAVAQLVRETVAQELEKPDFHKTKKS